MSSQVCVQHATPQTDLLALVGVAVNAPITLSGCCWVAGLSK